MSLPEFRVARPVTLKEALRLLADHGPEAMIIAGGTDVVPNLNMRLFSPRLLVDIKGIRELAGLQWDAARGLRIGALTSITGIAESPLVREKFSVLAQAASLIASPLLRNMGTVGGNLCLETRCLWYNQSYFWRKACGFCLKKDGDICHVAPGGKRCWAVWSGDSAPALLTLDAKIEIAGPRGMRTLPLKNFYRNDGMNRIDLARDEIVAAVEIAAEEAGWRGQYRKLRVRNSIDYPLAGVAVAMKTAADGTCVDVRVALTGVNPAPLLVPAATERLVGRKMNADSIEELAREAIRTGKPLTTSVSTPEYRREMVRVFTKRAVAACWNPKNN